MMRDGRVEKVHRSSATRYRLAGKQIDDNGDPRWAAVLRLVDEEGRVTRGLLAEHLGVSERTASRALKAMVEEGMVASDGRGGKHGGYTRARATALVRTPIGQ
jgi:predicted HTH transcriptional regulator